MKRKSKSTGNDNPEVNKEQHDEVVDFINKKKIQNKVLQEIIDKLQNGSEKESKKGK